MKKIIYCFLTILVPFICEAQDWSNYNSFYSQGNIPNDFTDNFAQKYEQMRERISNDASRTDQSSEDFFYQQTEYYIDDFLLSGEVVFGDTITKYCSQLLDRLLVHKPALRKKIRVYTVKSPEFNAYATESGIIFVNAGLLAEVENEAQLAFVLAHEVIHFEESHILQEFRTQTELDKETNFRQEDVDAKLKKLSSYSKSQELEADHEGFNRYFKQMGYASNEAVYLMDVMQYSYLPFDDTPFKYEFLETPGISFPDIRKLEVTQEISYDDDYDDSMSSHPNIRSRRDSIELVVDNKGSSQFLISEDWFNYCQRLARYETCRMHLVRREYPDAVYSAFLLSEKYGIDKFQRKVVAKALQNSASYKNKGSLRRILRDVDDVEGESQQLFYMWDEFKKRELNTLAVAYSYELHQDFPEDKDIEEIYRYALHNLVVENRMDLEDYDLLSYNSVLRAKEEVASFSANSKDSLALALDDTQANETRARNSKIQKIREKQSTMISQVTDTVTKVKVPLKPEKYYLNAFNHLQNDSTFLVDFKTLEKEQLSNGYADIDVRYATTGGRSRYGKFRSLGIDSLLMISPMYVNFDERDDMGVKFKESVEGQENYNRILDGLAAEMGVSITRLDYKELGVTETDVYNDLCVLKNWIEERMDHEDTGARMTNYDEIEVIRKKYGFNYVSYTGNLSVRMYDEKAVPRIITAVLIPFALPFLLPRILQSKNASYNFFYVFDLRNGAALMAKTDFYNSADKDVYLKSISYNNLWQVKGNF